VTKKEKEELIDFKQEMKDFYESFLLGEGAIEYVINIHDATLKSHLQDAKKFCYIPVENIDDLRNKLQDANFLSIERVSPWEIASIPVLNYDGDVHNFGYCRANYNIVNKWGHKRFYKCFQIIYSDDFFVRWFGCELIRKPVFWVSVEKMIYGITYSHKQLWLYPSACKEAEAAAGISPMFLDSTVQKYWRQLSNKYETNIERKLELDQCFKKGFFYKGPKYDFKIHYLYKDKLSEIKNVKAENGLFKIEIENKTYPHSGYAYLDLAKLKIVRAELGM
jgi:hypothetical protein